jgi:serine/threonine protein kinase
MLFRCSCTMPFRHHQNCTWSLIFAKAARCKSSSYTIYESVIRSKVRLLLPSVQQQTRRGAISLRYCGVRACAGVHTQVAFCASVCDVAVTTSCSKGYVHRDIKPENVLFTSDGHCKMVIHAVQTTEIRCNCNTDAG